MIIYSIYKLLNFYITFYKVKYNIQNVTLILQNSIGANDYKSHHYPQLKINAGKRKVYTSLNLIGPITIIRTTIKCEQHSFSNNWQS